MSQTDANGLRAAQYEDIGRIVVQATVLESLVDLLMRSCSGNVYLSDLFTAEAQWRWRYDKAAMLITGLVQERKVRDRARAWLDAVDRAQAARNAVVHNHWMPGQSADGTVRVGGSKIRARRGKQIEGAPLRLERVLPDVLAQLVEEMDRLRREFTPILDAVQRDVRPPTDGG